MFSLFGTFLRNLFVLSFASVWTLSSIAVDVQRIVDLPWASVGGRLLAMGLIGIAAFAGSIALLLYRRDGGRKNRAAAANCDEGLGFDPDAIIARHLARRASLMPMSTNGFGRRMR